MPKTRASGLSLKMWSFEKLLHHLGKSEFDEARFCCDHHKSALEEQVEVACCSLLAAPHTDNEG